MGFQVIITKKILKSEIHKIKYLPQIIGWRHYPKSHERKRCWCPACLTKGSFNSSNAKKLELKKLFKILRNTQDIDIIKKTLYLIGDLKIRDETGTREEELLKSYLKSNDIDLIILTIGCISELYQGDYKNYFFETIYIGKNIDIIDACICALMRICGDDILDEINIEKCNLATKAETLKIIEYMKKN
ncbi:MAG: hypothetical protein LBV69_03890 [Bacteroidales bacterium]|nr:hypothetical protein [Bacteroidales bacterium]